MMSGRVSPSESEDEDDIYSDCLVSLSSDGGSRGITILPGGLKLPRLRRRPSGKRQAPQPPRRPAPTSTPAPQSLPDTTAPESPSSPTPPVTTSLTPPSLELLTTVTLEINTTSTSDITPTPSLSSTPTPSLSTTPTPSPVPTPTPSLSTTPTPSPVPTPTPSPTPPVTTVQMVLKPDSLPVSDMASISNTFTTPPSTSTTSPTIPHNVEAPPPPLRSASVGATRNMMIRLIDDESDSESVMSDYFEDHIVFPPRPSPLPSSPPVVVTQTPFTSPTYLPRPPMSPPIMPPGGVMGGGVVTRGRARRLMHSNSDPGLPRAPRPQYSQEQYPRLPQSHYSQLPRPQFPPPPLELVSEEEGEDGVPAVPHRGKGLRRTSSSVTVGSLREELLVTPGILKLRLTLTNITVMTLVTAFALPHASILLYTGFRLVFGTLFPAYYSYKAVKTKNVKEYVKWMMYWIVFAFFTCFETLTDLFLSFWFPFYYELKILVVLWLLSPATRGSSILYRKFVHPWLARREDDIDQCIAQARQQGYSTVVQLGTKGVNYATTVLMQTAIKGGGGIMNQLRRSYSQNELVGSDDGDMNRNVKALPPHLHGDPHYADYALDHHALPQGSTSQGVVALSSSQPISTSQGVLAIPSQSLVTSHGAVALPSQSLATSQGVFQVPSYTQPHIQHALASQQLGISQPHSPETLQFIQQQMTTPVDPRSTLQHHTLTPEALLSLQQHMATPIVSGQSEDPYSSVRYTLSLGTPQGQIITPTVLKDTVDASYTPPLTRHRAKIQQTTSEQSS